MGFANECLALVKDNYKLKVLIKKVNILSL